MPIHDWRRVDAGVFHDFHTTWIGLLRSALNSGLLPSRYYALVERHARGLEPGVMERDAGTSQQRSLVIRHTSRHQLIALIEIVTPDQKASRNTLRALIDKSAAVLARGIQLLLIDLFPPGPHDPQGVQGALWISLGHDTSEQPADKPLTLAAYSADAIPTAYIDSVAVGDSLPDMPLFLEPEKYISVPLEATYQAAYAGTAEFYRNILEASPS